MPAITMREIQPSGYPELNRFYSRTTYKRIIQPPERAFIYQIDMEVIAAACIEEFNFGKVLRAVQVLEKFRGKSIGTELINFILTLEKSFPIYCLPYLHLENFYYHCGFNTVTSKNVPALLRERLHQYGESGLSLLCMKAEQRPADRQE